MTGKVDVEELIDHLKRNDLVIVPRTLTEGLNERYDQKAYENELRKKSALTFAEISNAKLWGDISARACKSYAKKYVPEELMLVNKGDVKLYKVPMSTVKKVQNIKNI